MAITLDGSLGITTPTYGGADTSEYLVPVTQFKNRIINGAMVIDQRNAGASVTSTTSQPYTVDRWQAQASASSKFTVQQKAGSVTPPVGFSNYLGVTSSAATSLGATDYYCLLQKIEGYNIADLNWGSANAKTVTISFWVRSSLTGTFGGALQNTGQARSYPFTYTISAANTWEQKSITIVGDTSGTWDTTNGVGIYLWLGLGVGSTYSGTAGSWSSSFFISATGATSVVGTNGATFYITGVQLEVGSTATSFDYRPYGTELALCQRYFQKSYDIATAPATNTQAGAMWSTGSSDSGGNAYMGIRYKVEMRTAPTLTAYKNDGTSGSWNYERSGASGSNTVTFDSNATSGCRGYVGNGGSAYATTLIFGQYIASAEL